VKQEMIFISYSRVNSDFAVRLAKDLDLAGINAWIDQSDIPTGARWDDTLEKAINDSSVFLVLLSPESTSSENVKDEISYAIDKGKLILPVMIKPCAIPLRLRRFQYVDFTNNRYETSLGEIKKLLARPQESIQRETEAEKPAKAEPVPNANTPTRLSSKMIITGMSLVVVALLVTIIFLYGKSSSQVTTENQQSTKITMQATSPIATSTQTAKAASPIATSTQTARTTSPIIATISFAEWMDVSASALGYPSDNDTGARFRAVHDYAIENGFIGGFPNFYNNEALNYGTILLRQGAAEWRDLSASELGYPSDTNVGARFRAVHDYARDNGFVGGFPNFYFNNGTLNYGTILLGQSVALWRDVPASELGYPANADAGTRFRAVHDYAIKNGFVGGFPNFFYDESKQVYGVILIKANP
jgi:hypothetical protein